MKSLLVGALLALLGAPCAAQEASPQTAAVPARELTPTEKKALEKAEKERKKFKDWIVVLESREYVAPPQTVGYVVWCGGPLGWVFCVSAPLNSPGGARGAHLIRLESSGEEKIFACGKGNQRLLLHPGRYPARKRWLMGVVETLVNVEGKLSKVLCVPH
ncbi:MAG: hypothetical protein M1453_07945 [Acidobacteria bacterium]|nr:hypothetical protein [Acidobacteriota bacterium]